MPAKRISYFSQVLVTPTSPCKKAASRPKPSARILTSSESIKIVEEKERKNKEKVLEKEAKKKQREEKKQQTQLKKHQKSAGGKHCL